MQQQAGNTAGKQQGGAGTRVAVCLPARLSATNAYGSIARRRTCEAQHAQRLQHRPGALQVEARACSSRQRKQQTKCEVRMKRLRQPHV